jgi:hypothetical protein
MGPNQYPVRDFRNSGLRLGQVPINTDLSSLLLVPDNSSCCLPGCRFIHGSQSSILLGFRCGARVRGKSQSILTCPCCWSLITAAVACLGAVTQVPISILLGISQQRGSGWARSQSILTCSLLLVPDNSSCCLPGCTLTTGSQSSILLGFRNSGARVRGRSQ